MRCHRLAEDQLLLSAVSACDSLLKSGGIQVSFQCCALSAVQVSSCVVSQYSLAERRAWVQCRVLCVCVCHAGSADGDGVSVSLLARPPSSLGELPSATRLTSTLWRCLGALSNVCAHVVLRQLCTVRCRLRNPGLAGGVPEQVLSWRWRAVQALHVFRVRLGAVMSRI